MERTSEVIAAGFLLVRPVPRPEWLTAELLPDRILSACDCVCPQFPGAYAISWTSLSAADRASAFDRVGLSTQARREAQEWATDSFEKAFGWPGVFFTLEAAREARARFFASSDLAVVGLGLPVEHAERFLREATPD